MWEVQFEMSLSNVYYVQEQFPCFGLHQWSANGQNIYKASEAGSPSVFRCGKRPSWCIP